MIKNFEPIKASNARLGADKAQRFSARTKPSIEQGKTRHAVRSMLARRWDSDTSHASRRSRGNFNFARRNDYQAPQSGLRRTQQTHNTPIQCVRQTPRSLAITKPRHANQHGQEARQQRLVLGYGKAPIHGVSCLLRCDHQKQNRNKIRDRRKLSRATHGPASRSDGRLFFDFAHGNCMLSHRSQHIDNARIRRLDDAKCLMDAGIGQIALDDQQSVGLVTLAEFSHVP